MSEMEIAFRKKHIIGSGCWTWLSTKDRNGYALFYYERKQYRAARLALKFDGRPVPAGMLACHHCDNPACVRPSHLYVGTHKQNSADAIARDRINHGVKAKLTPVQVLAIREAPGRHDEIARTYGVSRPAISMIKSRRTWKRLP